MLFVAIGIIVLVAVVVILVTCWNDGSSWDDNIIFALAGLVIAAVISSPGLGILPVEYGEMEQVNETELVSLSNATVAKGSGNFIYVSVSGENTYTYRYEVSSEVGTETSKEYKVATVSENVTEIEDVNCEVPVLREYVRRGKITLWTFGIVLTKEEYVFYVPEGTIQKELKLT